MIGRFTIVLGTVCLALGALLAVELTAGARPAASFVVASPKPADPQTPEVARMAPDHRGAIRTIVGRPLFTVSRRPAPESRPAARMAAAPTVFPRQLTGVVLDPTVQAAIFAGADKGKGTVVHIGETIEGWTLEAVTPSNVTVRAGHATQVVELPKSRGSSKAAASQRTPPAFTAPRRVMLRRDR